MSYFLPKSICTFCASGAFILKHYTVIGNICGYFALRILVDAGAPATGYFENVETSTGLKINWENIYKPFFHTLKSCTPGSYKINMRNIILLQVIMCSFAETYQAISLRRRKSKAILIFSLAAVWIRH